MAGKAVINRLAKKNGETNTLVHLVDTLFRNPNVNSFLGGMVIALLIVVALFIFILVKVK